MDDRRFRAFVSEMKRNWVHGEGIVVMLKVQADTDAEVRISGASSLNPGLILEKVMLWNGDELEYDGAVNTKDLKNVLTRLKVCGARFCTARSMGDKSVRQCYQDKRTDRCRYCPSEDLM